MNTFSCLPFFDSFTFSPPRLLQLDNSQPAAHRYCCTNIVHSFSLESHVHNHVTMNPNPQPTLVQSFSPTISYPYSTVMDALPFPSPQLVKLLNHTRYYWMNSWSARFRLQFNYRATLIIQPGSYALALHPLFKTCFSHCHFHSLYQFLTSSITEML